MVSQKTKVKWCNILVGHAVGRQGARDHMSGGEEIGLTKLYRVNLIVIFFKNYFKQVK